MFSLPKAIFLCLIATVVLPGCVVQSKYKTRSAMTQEETAAINTLYSPPQEAAPQRQLSPFLRGVLGPALKVNGIEVQASDIRDLYEYYGTFRQEDDLILKRDAAMQWIQTCAVMSQWPDKIEPAQQKIAQLRDQLAQGADFRNLILENSQEPGVEQSGGDLGTVDRGTFVPIFEMHAFTDPLNQISQPFPTVFGWHLMEILERDTTDPNLPKVHARHLLLFHGLDPANGDLIRQNLMRWTNLARVELLVPELNDILPQYVARTPAGVTDLPAAGSAGSGTGSTPSGEIR